MSSSEPVVETPAGGLMPAAMDWMLDVPVPVDFVLGTTTMTVRACTQLVVGSIVRLRQPAGDDLEVRVGGIPVFTGEVVVHGENLALRLGRVLPPSGQELA
ncbi:MAG: FliM/FliN family flagellar motor C-terminal domain-containing protein [Acidobacteriota bacterium]